MYGLRKRLKDGSADHWSGSSGAIYPLVQRLAAQHLLAADDHRIGSRHSKNYRLTGEGLVILRLWLSPPMPPDTVTLMHDPMCSRVQFFDAIDDRLRGAWFDDASAALDEIGHGVEEWSAQNTDECSKLVSDHHRRDLGMRRDWLRDSRAALLKTKEPVSCA